MAIVTKNIVEFNGGKVKVELDYRSGTLEVVALRVINGDEEHKCFAQAVDDESGRMHQAIFLPRMTTEIPIPTGPLQELKGKIGPKGEFVGVTGTVLYPY